MVNSVSEKMGKDELPPPPPPKYTDGLDHKQPVHIKVAAGSGSYAEAVKEFYIDEARKEKEKREKALAKQKAYLKAEQDKREAEDRAKREKIQEMLDNGDITPQ